MTATDVTGIDRTDTVQSVWVVLCQSGNSEKYVDSVYVMERDARYYADRLYDPSLIVEVVEVTLRGPQ